jgi:membrane protease YdiL (CAAX protease family)
MVVVAPVAEEFLFRGLILHGFLRNYSRRKAVLSAALLFALFHLNPWQLPGTFIMGLVLGWWLSETGSLLPCLLGHVLANVSPILLWLLWGSSADGGPKTGSAWTAVCFGVLGALACGTGLLLFRRQRSRRVM